MILLVKMAIPRLRSLVEGSLEVKLPSRGGKSQRREEKRRDETRREERRSEKRKSQKKEDAGARKVEKSRLTVFFQ